MSKTISINPDLFTFTSNKRNSRKKEKTTNNNEIKIKNPEQNKEKHRKVRKQHILRFLREKQEQNYKKLLENDEKKDTHVDNTFNNDFEESVKYFNDLSKKSDKHNFTCKIHHENENPILLDDLQPLPDSVFDNVNNRQNTFQISDPNIQNASNPSWGCLKNGNLPTFRDWKRHTQKNYDDTTMNDKKHEIKAMMLNQVKKDEPTLNLRLIVFFCLINFNLVDRMIYLKWLFWYLIKQYAIIL